MNEDAPGIEDLRNVEQAPQFLDVGSHKNPVISCSDNNTHIKRNTTLPTVMAVQ
jgi:hypothetical protein